jgi:dTDP-D-glucose 4,6-dehydratase
MSHCILTSHTHIVLLLACGCSIDRYGIPIIVCRGNNVYGPRQYPEKVLPKFIHRAMRGMPMCIHGPGQQLRSYLYVGDVAAAFDVILHRGVTGEVSECVMAWRS